MSDQMKVSLNGLIENSITEMKGESREMYAYSLRELVENMQEVKKKHLKGKSKEILDEFFKCYVVEVKE